MFGEVEMDVYHSADGIFALCRMSRMTDVFTTIPGDVTCLNCLGLLYRKAALTHRDAELAEGLLQNRILSLIDSLGDL